MYIITYDLKKEALSSDPFYKTLEVYSKEVYQELDELHYESVMAYFRMRLHEDLEVPYALEEAYLELLTLGVFWTVYSGDAQATGDFATGLLQKLADVRATNRHLKPLADTFRGVCLTAMMSPDLYDHMGVAAPTVSNLKDLLDWLESTGEFVEEVNRLRHWERFILTLPVSKATTLLESIISTGLWFEKDSIEGLGRFTEDVDRYLNEHRPKRYWREDVIFCGRRRVEYHLNMIGAEWLNIAYKSAFDQRPVKLVLVPTCLRLLKENECMAQVVGDWLICQNCQATCQVAQLSDLMPANAKLYMVPHQSSLSSIKDLYPLQEIGIVGVSCVLNLLAGGWMLESKGIPAQCVILDYCGCQSHWHPSGIPTGLNHKRLLDLLT